MKLYTALEAQSIDRHAIGTLGMDAAALMETAGRSLAAAALEMLGAPAGKRVVLLIGKGNNGGDGLVAARVLYDAGASVFLALSEPLAVMDPEEGAVTDRDDADLPPALRNLRIALAMGIPMGSGSPFCPGEWDRPDLCIDALLGVGASGPPRGSIVVMVHEANYLSCPVLSADIPTGLDATTGAVEGECVRADATVTFGVGKVGLFSEPGAQYAGKVTVVDIGVPAASVGSAHPSAALLDREQVRQWLPNRPASANKGTFGSVLIAAGSAGMMGAAAFCSRSAMRSGAGIARLVVPEGLLLHANAMTPEIICVGVPGSRLGPDALAPILEHSARSGSFAIGPGIGTDDSAAALLEAVLAEIKTPMVIDADALNLLSGHMEWIGKLRAPAVLTPHPGEMARLLGSTTGQVQAARIESARKLAVERGVVVLLKGSATVIASPGGEIWINPTGNSGMATAGAGDVLTGLIAGLIARGMPVDRAACAGAFIHGLAGDLAMCIRGRAGMLASDILEQLPAAQEQIRA